MTRYYGVIGNRDYIKFQGQRRPFWEFLDRQPDGWLCSLVYRRNDVPVGKPMIWDIGAWSYRAADIPQIGKDEVTPQWAADQYRDLARPGDMVVAPDHMLIPGVDLDRRRIFNRRSAVEFIQLCSISFRPMAVVHGVELSERLKYARFLMDLGYRHLALGGLAGRASHKKMILETVRTLRFEYPDIWLHVLGVSAPAYAARWLEIGIDSFDGASHFKQAFTAGKFFMAENGSLVSYKAVRRGEVVTDLPLCDCRACARLQEAGIDTRSYGSNENNMGRAAHNLNQLIKIFTHQRSRYDNKRTDLSTLS